VRHRASVFFAMALLCILAPRIDAAEPPVPQEEVPYLIGAVEMSGCAFYRNGARYDAVRAAAHMREKYALVGERGVIASGEVFIDKVATRSALTGLAYEIECPGRERLELAVWLRDVLARHRANGAPRELRGTR
jgi:Family of unknown function (DUF5329)